MRPQHLGLFSLFQEYLYRGFVFKGRMWTEEVVLHQVMRKKAIPDFNWFGKERKGCFFLESSIESFGKGIHLWCSRESEEVFDFFFFASLLKMKKKLSSIVGIYCFNRNTESNLHSSEKIRSIL